MNHLALTPTIMSFQGQPAVQLVCPLSGSQAVILLHGAQVVSWRPVTSPDQPGLERLYLSDHAVFSNGQAVRGGIPVIFPQFEQRGPLPRHGFARTTEWTLSETKTAADHALAVFSLTATEQTRTCWPYNFATELTVSISQTRLDIELSIVNQDKQGFQCTAALHTYLRIYEPLTARLEGLCGHTYWDQLSQREEVEVSYGLGIESELDRIYMGVKQPLQLRDANKRLGITMQGFEDIVVWNPGASKCATLKDMAPQGWREMLCVEAAQIMHPIELAPEAEWVGRQSLLAI